MSSAEAVAEVQFARAAPAVTTRTSELDGGPVPFEPKPLQKKKDLRRAIPVGSANLLKGKRVLVTGGAGFVGSHIVDLLVDAGCAEIVVVDNMVRGRPENLAERCAMRRKISVVDGDIRDTQLMADLVDGHATPSSIRPRCASPTAPPSRARRSR